MLELARELQALEEQLLQHSTRASAVALDELLCDDFIEFGASGEVFDKAAIIASLSSETSVLEYTMHDFRVSQLSPGVALVTYRLEVGQPPENAGSRRSSVWIHHANRWRLRFHQGTRLRRA